MSDNGIPVSTGGWVFDVDGVLTDTASLHYRAWKALFDRVLPSTVRSFGPDDYHRLVDGRPRLVGLRAVLSDRGLDIPTGSESDPPGVGTVRAMAALKQQEFLGLLDTVGVRVFPDALLLLDRLDGVGVPAAAASASRNMHRVLASAGIESRFRATVDGNDAAALHLEPKPRPDLFLEAARRLRTTPDRCALVEDALAGVRAGHEGGFHPVVGVDRSGGKWSTQLSRWADIVVPALDRLDPTAP